MRVWSVVEHDGRHQRAGRAGLHAFAAGDAGRLSPIGSSKSNTIFGVVAAIGHADHVVDLDLAAGADAQPALDAGVEVDRHRRMADVGLPALGGREAALGDARSCRPSSRTSSRDRARSRAPAGRRPAAPSPSCCAASARALSDCHLHADASACACRRRPARARPRSRPCRRGNCRRAGSPAPASSRDAGSRVPCALGDLPDRLAGAASTCWPSSSNWILRHSAASFGTNSSGKYFITDSADSRPPGRGRRSRRRASPGSARRAAAGSTPAAPSACTAFSVPTRQGVHWPQLSSSKNRIRFSADAAACRPGRTGRRPRPSR